MEIKTEDFPILKTGEHPKCAKYARSPKFPQVLHLVLFSWGAGSFKKQEDK